jgi:YgiT-type zinc finger domain-containing protein
MPSSIASCSGDREEREIHHTVRYKGQLIVIDHVPAEVCTVCGDVLLRPETVRKIQAMVRESRRPAGSVPLYGVA